MVGGMIRDSLGKAGHIGLLQKKAFPFIPTTQCSPSRLLSDNELPQKLEVCLLNLINFKSIYLESHVCVCACKHIWKVAKALML